MASLAEMLAGLSGDPEAQGAANTSEAMAPAVNAHFGALAQQMADWAQQQQAMNQRLQGQPLSQQALDPEGLQSAMSMALSTGPGAMETPAQKIMRVNNLMARNDMDAAKQGADNFFQNHTSGQIIPAYDAQGNPLPVSPPPIRAYHGSPYDFDAFDASKIGSTTDPGALGRALYFSTDPRVAESEQHRYEVNLNVANPVSLAKSEWGIPGNGMAEKRQLVTKALDLPADASPEQISQAAMQRGHDSVSLDYSPLGYKHQEIAVFDPKIIDIVKKYGLAGLLATGAATMGGGDKE